MKLTADLTWALRAHFRESDLPLLVSYVQAIDLDARASKELRKVAVIGGKASPWLTVQEETTRAIVADTGAFC
jgi:hypothetical protein